MPTVVKRLEDVRSAFYTAEHFAKMNGNDEEAEYFREDGRTLHNLSIVVADLLLAANNFLLSMPPGGIGGDSTLHRSIENLKAAVQNANRTRY